MFNAEFWGEPISVYTDADALEDGILTDVSELRAEFNGKIINRIACEAGIALKIVEKTSDVILSNLRFIAANCKFDGEGAEAWGIFCGCANLGDAKFWLIPNEVGGYTLLTPDEY